MNTDMHEPDTEQTPPSPPPPGAPRGWQHTPLSRMPKGGPEGGKVGGVVAGLSRAYGFDLHTTRIATVVAMIILPFLLLVYAAAWVLLPESPAQARPIEAVLRDRRRLPLLFVIGLVLVIGGLGSLGSWFLFRGAPWGLVLIGLGVLLWASSTTSRRDPAPPPTVANFTPPATFPGSPTSFPPPTVGAAVTAEHPVTSARHATAVATPRRVRRPITSIGVGVAVLWVATASVLEALGWWQAPALWVTVVAIAIVMVAMTISIAVNHSWILPIPLVVLGAALVTLCVAQPRLDGATGQRTVRPDTVALAEAPQHLAVGQLTIDLRDVPLNGHTVTIDAEVGMGQLRVLVPTDADVVLTAEVGAGQMQMDGDELADGLRQDVTRSADADIEPAAGLFELDLRAGMGQISVERVASTA